MTGSRVPIAVSHGEGYAEFRDGEALERARRSWCCASLTTEARRRMLSLQPERLAARHHRSHTPDGRYTI